MTLTDNKMLLYTSKATLERAGHRCEYPDCNIKYTHLHAHHLYSRRHVSLRYNLDNMICLCPYHHTMGSFSAHHDPDFKNLIVATGVRTEELFDKLRAERNRVQKNTAQWKQECYEKLKVYL
jgi:hypothetical protein